MSDSPRQIKWLSTALEDIERLNDFLQPLNPQAAQKAVISIQTSAEALLDNPRRGIVYDAETGLRQIFIPFGQRGYVMRYLIEEEAVVIVRVWHARESR